MLTACSLAPASNLCSVIESRFAVPDNGDAPDCAKVCRWNGPIDPRAVVAKSAIMTTTARRPTQYSAPLIVVPTTGMCSVGTPSFWRVDVHDEPERAARFKGFDIIFSFRTMSRVLPSPAPPLTRRAPCSTWWPCGWNADGCMQPDVMANPHLQAPPRPWTSSGHRCSRQARS